MRSYVYAPYTNGSALASMILGILGVWFLALIFGYSGKTQIIRARGAQRGMGFATAGIVLGWIGAAITALILVMALLAGCESRRRGFYY